MPTDLNEKFVLTVSTAIFVLGVLLACVNHEYFHHVYSAEDGLLEWLTVLALITVAVVLGNHLRQHGRLLSWRHRSVLTVLVILTVFGAGEEISWGQRLFGFESSEFFLKHNRQKEINLHNLATANLSVNKDLFSKGALVLFLVYLGLITPLYHKIHPVRQFCKNWGVPIPKRYQYCGYWIAIFVVEGLLHAVTDTPRRGELTEFIFSVLVALTLIYPANGPLFPLRTRD